MTEIGRRRARRALARLAVMVRGVRSLIYRRYYRLKKKTKTSYSLFRLLVDHRINPQQRVRIRLHLALVALLQDRRTAFRFIFGIRHLLRMTLIQVPTVRGTIDA